MKGLAYGTVITLIDGAKDSPYNGDFDCRWLYFKKLGVSILHHMSKQDAA